MIKRRLRKGEGSSIAFGVIATIIFMSIGALMQGCESRMTYDLAEACIRAGGQVIDGQCEVSIYREHEL